MDEGLSGLRQRGACEWLRSKVSFLLRLRMFLVLFEYSDVYYDLHRSVGQFNYSSQVSVYHDKSLM